MEPALRHAATTGVVPDVSVVPVADFRRVFVPWSAQVYDLGAQTVVTEHPELPPTLLPPSTSGPVTGTPGKGDFVPIDALNWSKKRGALQGQWSRDLDDAVKKVLSEDIEKGRSVPDQMNDLKAVFKDFGDARLETIARTETTEAFNGGRGETAERINKAAAEQDAKAAAKDGEGKGRQRKPKGPYLVAAQCIGIGDARQTAICRSRDGKIILPDTPQARNGKPNLHYNCRTILRYISRLEYPKLESGDSAAVKRAFGWTGAKGPKSLDEALDWSGVLPPMKGFGTAVSF